MSQRREWLTAQYGTFELTPASVKLSGATVTVEAEGVSGVKGAMLNLNTG